MPMSLLLPNKNRDFFDTLKNTPPYGGVFFSLSKNYPKAPVSGKIGTGVLSWTNGRRMLGGMWYL